MCATCEGLGRKSILFNDYAKRVASNELLVHKHKPKDVYIKSKEVGEMTKNGEDVACLCYDYMQHLPLPHIPVQEVFYLRHLWVYVFCIHNVGGDSLSTPVLWGNG